MLCRVILKNLSVNVAIFSYHTDSTGLCEYVSQFTQRKYKCKYFEHSDQIIYFKYDS